MRSPENGVQAHSGDVEVERWVLLRVHRLVGVPYTLGDHVGARVGKDLQGGRKAGVSRVLASSGLPMDVGKRS